MTTIAVELRITPEALLRLPDNNGTELVDGQLVEKSGSDASSRIGAGILILLGTEARSAGDAVVYGSDLGYRCFSDPERIRKPDVSIIRRDRLAPLQGDVGYILFAADLAVEVLSPNELVRDVSLKTEEYLSAGFKLVWIVYPSTSIVEIHRRDGTVTKLHADDEITGESALPGFRCRVADLLA